MEDSEVSEDKKNILSFKNPNFEHKSLVGSKKKIWRNLKQITALEKSYKWPEDAVLYSSIEAPPSFKPTKKYSDISGLPALYKDPMTKLRYSNSAEFSRARSLPMDLVNGLLELRKAGSIVG